MRISQYRSLIPRITPLLEFDWDNKVDDFRLCERLCHGRSLEQSTIGVFSDTARASESLHPNLIGRWAGARAQRQVAFRSMSPRAAKLQGAWEEGRRLRQQKRERLADLEWNAQLAIEKEKQEAALKLKEEEAAKSQLEGCLNNIVWQHASIPDGHLRFYEHITAIPCNGRADAAEDVIASLRQQISDLVLDGLLIGWCVRPRWVVQHVHACASIKLIDRMPYIKMLDSWGWSDESISIALNGRRFGRSAAWWL